MRKIAVLGRMAICALLPNRVVLRRRFRSGVVAAGPNRAGYGGRGVFIFGEALEPELDVLDRLLRPNDVFIDVGASSGVYTLKASTIVGPGGLVVSVEPNPEMLAILHTSVQRNRLPNVRARGLAASERCGPAELFCNYGRPNSFGLRRRSDDPSSFNVLSVPLDRLLEWEGVTRVDFLKVDAEGAEVDVLIGAREVIARHSPAILAEVIFNGVTHVPAGYARWRAPGSPNALLLARGHHLVSVVERLGWQLEEA
jgi:FkbM family methyltransferase